MDMLQDLLGGQRQQEYDDFATRYEQGSPWTGFDDAEAARRYDEIAPRLSPQQYESSAEQAFSRLTPDQRAEFGRWLAQQSRERNLDMTINETEYEDPRRLAQYTSRVRQEQPDLLGQLVGSLTGGGSSGGGLLSSPIAKAALGGIAATAFRSMSGR